MFAQDTTIYDAHDDINSLISKFKKRFRILIAWCIFNKLDLNCSKSFFMLLTNKRVKPNEIFLMGFMSKLLTLLNYLVLL